MPIPLINEHLFCKYFVRLSVGNATKGFATYGCFHPRLLYKTTEDPKRAILKSFSHILYQIINTQKDKYTSYHLLNTDLHFINSFISDFD